MSETEPPSNRPGCLRVAGYAILLFGLLFVFREEVKLFWDWFFFLKGDDQVYPGDPQKLIFFLLATALLFFFSLIFLYITSQFMFPVQSWKVFQHFMLYLLGFHGPVIMVRSGRQVHRVGSKVRFLPGVLLVDLESAVVVEKLFSNQNSTGDRTRVRINPGELSSLEETRSRKRPPQARVAGPGVAFLGRYERVRGMVSLRKQFRINLDVKAYTKDGVEVETKVYVIFTLGQEAKVLKVAYVGERIPENLRVLQINEKLSTIVNIQDTLDKQDQMEIHQFVQGLPYSGATTRVLTPDDDCREYPPFTLDKERILSAVYTQALHVKDGSHEGWTDLPTKVATENMRGLISAIDFDDLFAPERLDKTPWLDEIKPRLNLNMRNLGVLAFQYVQRRDGRNPKKGQKLLPENYRIYEPKNLCSPKVLRNRGIKIIYAGFTELTPINPDVCQQRIDNWSSRWQKATEETRADYDREVIRIRHKARIDAQREMVFNLSEIFKTAPHSQEALALQFFQALESAATDPLTQKLLPRDTIDLLRSLRYWLLGEEEQPLASLRDEIRYQEGDGRSDQPVREP